MTKRKVIIGVIVALVVILAAGILVPAWPPSYNESTLTELCVRCGIRRHVTTADYLDDNEPPADSTSFATTSLSDWYLENIATECNHEWQFNHSTSHSYASFCGVRWRLVGSASSSPTPDLVWLSPDDQVKLEELLADGSEKCKEYITSRLRRQRKSGSAKERYFDPPTRNCYGEAHPPARSACRPGNESSGSIGSNGSEDRIKRNEYL